jgi:small neutral amino acid transporter SnatA (MarC family)
MLRNAMFMFAGVFFAWLSGFVSIRTIYVIGGILYILTGLYALSNKALRESQITPDTGQM